MRKQAIKTGEPNQAAVFRGEPNQIAGNVPELLAEINHMEIR